jgi:hypothetical protein
MQEVGEVPAAALGDDRMRRLARRTALLITGLFAAQLIYITVAEEPYPAIMMPRFSWAGPNQASQVDILVPEIVLTYADSSQQVLTQGELLRDFPTGHHPSIMASMLSPLPASPRARRAPAGKFEPPTWLFRGYALARADRQNPERVASLRDWLRGRSHALYAASPVVRCTVNWYDDSYSYDTHGDSQTSRRGHTLNGTFEIDLHEDSTPVR